MKPTPIAGVIKAAQKDLEGQSGDKAENLIYGVSDGVETCDGDPAAAAKSITESIQKAKVNVIGFDGNDKGRQSLKKLLKLVAENTNRLTLQLILKSIFLGK